MNHNDEIYYQFFSILESKLEQELQSIKKWKFKITNDFILFNQLSISVELRLSSGIIIKIVCNERFPTESPHVFCVNNFEGIHILNPTKEIDYSSFYYWLANKKLIKLINQIDIFYEQNKPTHLLIYDDFYEEFQNLENLITFNFLEFEKSNENTNEQFAESVPDSINSSIKLKEIRQAFSKLIDNIEIEIGFIRRKSEKRRKYFN